jgi:hypothetical protein
LDDSYCSCALRTFTTNSYFTPFHPQFLVLVQQEYRRAYHPSTVHTRLNWNIPARSKNSPGIESTVFRLGQARQEGWEAAPLYSTVHSPSAEISSRCLDPGPAHPHLQHAVRPRFDPAPLTLSPVRVPEHLLYCTVLYARPRLGTLGWSVAGVSPHVTALSVSTPLTA